MPSDDHRFRQGIQALARIIAEAHFGERDESVDRVAVEPSNELGTDGVVPSKRRSKRRAAGHASAGQSDVQVNDSERSARSDVDKDYDNDIL